jgi:peptide/nickel transport system permease protein
VVAAAWLVCTVILWTRGWGRLAGALDFGIVSLPTMFSGVLIALIASRVGFFQAFSGRLATPSDWLALLPAVLALALYPAATLSRIARAEFRRVDGSPYSLTAKGGGIDEAYRVGVLLGRNVSVPLLSALSLQVPILFSGAFVVEIIFSVPGGGSLLLRSILNRDLPMIQGLLLANGLIIVLSHFFFEILQLAADPRLRGLRAS